MSNKVRLCVTGRGDLIASASADDRCLIIRLDDDRRPEFWAEVILCEDELAGLLALLRETKEAR